MEAAVAEVADQAMEAIETLRRLSLPAGVLEVSKAPTPSGTKETRICRLHHPRASATREMISREMICLLLRRLWEHLTEVAQTMEPRLARTVGTTETRTVVRVSRCHPARQDSMVPALVASATPLVGLHRSSSSLPFPMVRRRCKTQDIHRMETGRQQINMGLLDRRHTISNQLLAQVAARQHLAVLAAV